MITVVIPVSPIASHPETRILEEAVGSIRHHLPDAELILTFDGVRPEQVERKSDYEEHIRRVLWLADKSWGNTLPVIFDEHRHQSGMMRNVLDRIDTPLLMYVEADTPVVTDEPIDFPAITHFIEHGESNLVRLHHEAFVPVAHEHMVHGLVETSINDGPRTAFLRTSQWSQRPHIASVAYYRRILDCYFTPDAKSFIEDRMHGVVDQAYRVDGMAGWNQHRLHIYHPGGNIKRSYHLDGRAGEAKYDDAQIF